jgi:hypothetical protein
MTEMFSRFSSSITEQRRVYLGLRHNKLVTGIGGEMKVSLERESPEAAVGRGEI